MMLCLNKFKDADAYAKGNAIDTMAKIPDILYRALDKRGFR